MNKISKNFNSLTIIAMGFATAFAFFCFFYQIKHPPCCDANGYMRMAMRYVANGISPVEPELDPLRLYGYPYFLSIVIKVSNFLGIQHSILIFLTQLSLYLFFLLKLVRHINSEYSERIATIVLLALSANIFIYPYIAISLTDGFTAILVVALAYISLKILTGILNDKDDWYFSVHYVILGFIVGFQIMVRPASVYMIGFLISIVLFYLICKKERSISSGLSVILSAAIGFTLAITPQVVFNFTNFKVLKFLPVADLGSTQLDWGINQLKYLTNLTGGNLQMCYKSPWAVNVVGEGISWYINNPVDGIKTIFMHLYGVLDFDYLFPYVYKLETKYSPYLFIYSQFIIFWGFVGLISSTKALLRIKIDSVSRSSKVIFIFYILSVFSFILGWCCIHAFPGSENRWSLPLIILLLPMAFWSIGINWRQMHQHKILYVTFLLYLAVAYNLSSFLSSLKVFCN